MAMNNLSPFLILEARLRTLVYAGGNVRRVLQRLNGIMQGTKD